MLVISTVLSLVLGLLPLIDNFAHLGGFICGLLSSLLVIPKLTLPPSDLLKRKKWKLKIILRMVAAGLLLVAYFVVALCILDSLIYCFSKSPFCFFQIVSSVCHDFLFLPTRSDSLWINRGAMVQSL